MTRVMASTRVLLPAGLVEKVDRRVGKRKRGEFIAAAVEQELHREELLEALDAFVGSMDFVETPGWETHESTVEWVRAQRRPPLRNPLDTRL